MRGFRSVIAALLLRPVLYLLMVALSLLLVGCWAVWRVVLVLYELDDRFSDSTKRE